MEWLTTVGRTFFALALLALGVEHIIFQAFVMGGIPPWPDPLPGEPVWAYLTGLFFIAASVAIIVRRHARIAALLVGAVIFLWAVPLHIPVVATDSILAATWTSAAKALKESAGAWAIAATLPAVAGGRDRALLRWVNRRHLFVVLGRIGLAAHMVVAGIQHFLFAEFVASLIPGWFPGDPVLWTYFAGAALIAGGVGLNVPRTARLAALLSGLMIFSWFWIVHVPTMFDSINAGVSVFGALASSGIAFVLAGYAASAERTRRRTAEAEWIPGAGRPTGVAATGDG